MAKKKVSMAERMRQRHQQKAEKDAENSGGGIEWTPKKNGKYLIRVLPFEHEGEIETYYTHSYHYLDGVGKGKGTFVFSKPKYENGEVCPIDEQVSELFDAAKENNDSKMRNIASSIKRKKRYYFNILLLEEDGNKVPVENQHRILVDTTNQGKLAKEICKSMGIPFYYSFQDNWVDKDTLSYDEDEVHYDLIDYDEGHDFKIVRTSIKKPIGGGRTIDELDFTGSLVARKPTPLTDEQKQIAENEVKDLVEYVDYVSREQAEKYLNAYMVSKGYMDNDEDEDEEEKTSSKKRKKASDVDEEALLEELEDDDSEEDDDDDFDIDDDED